eukprot:261562_1
MTAKDYSFKSVGTVEPIVPIVEAIPEDQSTETYQDEEAENPSDTAIMVGCGILGWVVAGPFLAIITAFGGKYAADRNQGPLGDTSRAVGRITSAAGKKAKEEHLLDKLKTAASSLFTKEDCKCKNRNSQARTSN